ncbi:hypothetical protein LY78DRAFT_192827 [Colletotrichum sublineola]|nr:hypothetical protein LY78DRAFT_192827 [Colletotrichum sublineola]
MRGGPWHSFLPIKHTSEFIPSLAAVPTDDARVSETGRMLLRCNDKVGTSAYKELSPLVASLHTVVPDGICYALRPLPPHALGWASRIMHTALTLSRRPITPWIFRKSELHGLRYFSHPRMTGSRGHEPARKKRRRELNQSTTPWPAHEQSLGARTKMLRGVTAIYLSVNPRFQG